METNKSPFPLCSINEPLIDSIQGPLNVIVNQTINFFPIVELDIWGNRFYYGVRKYLFAVNVDNLENGHIQDGKQDTECQSHNISIRSPEVHMDVRNESAIYQIIMPHPLSIKASFYTHIIASQDLEISLSSNADKPSVFFDSLDGLSLENALFKLAITTKKEYIDAVIEVEKEINDKYEVSVQTINKMLPLKATSNE